MTASLLWDRDGRSFSLSMMCRKSGTRVMLNPISFHLQCSPESSNQYLRVVCRLRPKVWTSLQLETGLRNHWRCQIVQTPYLKKSSQYTASEEYQSARKMIVLCEAEMKNGLLDCMNKVAWQSRRKMSLGWGKSVCIRSRFWS